MNEFVPINNIRLSADDHAANSSALELFAKNCGMALFGVADAAAIRAIYHPSLVDNPATASMTRAVSMAFALSDAVLESVFTEPTPLYAMHYNRANSLLDDTALRVATIIQNSGFSAMPIPASQIIDKASQKGYLNHKLVAVEAGVGHIGRNNLLVTKRFGSRVRLVTVLTDAPLEASKKAADGCGSCRACVGSCPAGAIGETAADFNLPKCVALISGFQKIMFVAKGICGICVKACRGRGVA